MMASIRQYDKPWPCCKDYGREKKIAVYLLVADDGNVLDVRVNGCDDMDGSEQCASCCARVLHQLQDRHLGNRL